MYNPKLPNDKKKKETIRLCWWILEQKLIYYHPDKVDRSPVSDEVYDANEDMYKRYCEDLGIRASACEHVGFPMDTPSGRMVFLKMTGNTVLPEKRVRKRIRKNSDSDEKPRRRRRRPGQEENVKVNRVRVRKRGPTKD